MNHSRIGASSYYRWKACPGSVRLCEGIPHSSSSYADEGTLAHTLVERMLNNKLWAANDYPPDMLIHAGLYVDCVLADMTFNSTLLIEHTFDLSSLFPGMFGTADAVLYDPDEQLLRVYDFKYGAGIPVEVEKNLQLMYYALGAITTLPQFKPLEVELVIVQPRCPHPDGPIRRDRISIMDFYEFSDDLVEAATATTAPNAPLHPGDHCRFCAAAGVCPALVEKAQSLAKVEFASSNNSMPQIITPEKLGQILTWLPVLEQWIKNAREYGYQTAYKGQKIPGWKLVPKRATRAWRHDERTVEALRAHGVTDDQIFTTKLKSVSYIERKVKRPRNGDYWFHDLYVSSTSGEVLAPTTDKRKEVKIISAKEEFSKLE